MAPRPAMEVDRLRLEIGGRWSAEDVGNPQLASRL
jgi:hypothetical protein